MIEPPASDESAPYYLRYIARVPAGDIVETLRSQGDEIRRLISGISEEKSLSRYAPGKWSVRQVVNHVSDTERVFLSRALWFARGFDSPLPGFEQDVSAAHAGADGVPWADHVEELRAVRLATVAFFRNLPEEAWMRRGVASGNPFSVRALAWITAGHASHHAAILRERYLSETATLPES
jgi:uncharacterized damage-inducible protein DinB